MFNTANAILAKPRILIHTLYHDFVNNPSSCSNTLFCCFCGLRIGIKYETCLHYRCANFLPVSERYVYLTVCSVADPVVEWEGVSVQEIWNLCDRLRWPFFQLILSGSRARSSPYPSNRRLKSYHETNVKPKFEFYFSSSIKTLAWKPCKLSARAR